MYSSGDIPVKWMNAPPPPTISRSRIGPGLPPAYLESMYVPRPKKKSPRIAFAFQSKANQTNTCISGKAPANSILLKIIAYLPRDLLTYLERDIGQQELIEFTNFILFYQVYYIGWIG